MLIAHVPQKGEYEYYKGKFENFFDDLTFSVHFKKGNYLIMV